MYDSIFVSRVPSLSSKTQLNSNDNRFSLNCFACSWKNFYNFKRTLQVTEIGRIDRKTIKKLFCFHHNSLFRILKCWTTFV